MDNKITSKKIKDIIKIFKNLLKIGIFDISNFDSNQTHDFIVHNKNNKDLIMLKFNCSYEIEYMKNNDIECEFILYYLGKMRGIKMNTINENIIHLKRHIKNNVNCVICLNDEYVENIDIKTCFQCSAQICEKCKPNIYKCPICRIQFYN